ncbi:MAG: multidrug ABC transporter substrate-binding protein [Candidatus Azobacteroides sp.]|nr:multidrug ABC transporter substrate-binding protein [Candidatus Azobacteroides sp.]
MIKHILKMIWAQRKSNVWIYAELLVVVSALWFMGDKFYVDLRTYYSPLGYDITNTWRFKLNKLNSQLPAYVPEEESASDQATNLQQLMSQIRQHPLVDGVCVCYYSCPYSWGNRWGDIASVEGDTSLVAQKVFQIRSVSPEYFEVFRIKDSQGNPITTKLLEGSEEPILVSQDMGEELFPKQSAKGRKICIHDEGPEITILAVTPPIRSNEYCKSDPCLFEIIAGADYAELINNMGVENAELCVRMKKGLSQDEMFQLLEEMGDRLRVSNLNVYGVSSIADMRKEQLASYKEENNKQLALMTFLLINVFFGIIGTFWLRTQQRQGEAGIRMALGANHFTLGKYLYGEGLCLLLLTLPFTLAFAGNMIYMGIPDADRLPLTVGRFLLVFGGTYGLLAFLIALGVWFPVQKIFRIKPAEALHYE